MSGYLIMTKYLSRCDQLIANMHHVALQALANASGGQLRRGDLMQAIETSVPLDDWACAVYEGSGNTRWRSIFSFASLGLVKGGYVTKSRGVWTITDEGRIVVAQPFNDSEFLAEVERRYRVWKNSQIESEIMTSPQLTEQNDGEDCVGLEAPEERIARTIKTAHDALAAELIETIKQCESAFFEKLVIDLLLEMGYGGNRQEAGQHIGQTGDGGIDGIINEDRLGLDAIYLQAKRWDKPVCAETIREFFGALDIKGVKKGVLITTSRFTDPAKKAVESNRSDKKIVLIDGSMLAKLMIEHSFGVSVIATYNLKRLDAGFFTDD
jgi:restriction system protein